MSLDRYVARNSQVAARRLGEEMMIMSCRDSTLFTLNEVASLIWEAADGSTTLAEIVRSRICPQFEVEPAQALRDANELVEGLAEHGILLLSPEPFRTELLGQESK